MQHNQISPPLLCLWIFKAEMAVLIDSNIGMSSKSASQCKELLSELTNCICSLIFPTSPPIPAQVSFSSSSEVWEWRNCPRRDPPEEHWEELQLRPGVSQRWRFFTLHWFDSPKAPHWEPKGKLRQVRHPGEKIARTPGWKWLKPSGLNWENYILKIQELFFVIQPPPRQERGSDTWQEIIASNFQSN